MKRICIAFAFALSVALCACASTNLPGWSTVTVVTDTNGVLKAPANFIPTNSIVTNTPGLIFVMSDTNGVLTAPTNLFDANAVLQIGDALSSTGGTVSGGISCGSLAATSVVLSAGISLGGNTNVLSDSGTNLTFNGASLQFSGAAVDTNYVQGNLIGYPIQVINSNLVLRPGWNIITWGSGIEDSPDIQSLPLTNGLADVDKMSADRIVLWSSDTSPGGGYKSYWLNEDLIDPSKNKKWFYFGTSSIATGVVIRKGIPFWYKNMAATNTIINGLSYSYSMGAWQLGNDLMNWLMYGAFYFVDMRRPSYFTAPIDMAGQPVSNGVFYGSAPNGLTGLLRYPLIVTNADRTLTVPRSLADQLMDVGSNVTYRAYGTTTNDWH